MRQGQHNKRARGRGRKPQNPANRTYDSNGPDVKIRGTAAHIADKYQSLARDAQVAGDPISAENYMQHAEHYSRIIAAAQAQMQAQAQNQQQQQGAQDQPQNGAQARNDDTPDSDTGDKAANGSDAGEQPAVNGASRSSDAGSEDEARPKRGRGRRGRPKVVAVDGNGMSETSAEEGQPAAENAETPQAEAPASEAAKTESAAKTSDDGQAVAEAG